MFLDRRRYLSVIPMCNLYVVPYLLLSVGTTQYDRSIDSLPKGQTDAPCVYYLIKRRINWVNTIIIAVSTT